MQDTGIGIAEEAKVFDPFVTSKPNGWGLGLYIARQIITAHHGTIDYTTELGRGTIFKIALPAAGRDRTLDSAMVIYRSSS
jgi:signal transduction histidine kinase